MAAKTIDEYILSLGGDWRAEVVGELRNVVDSAAPEAKATIKWAQPVWESNGPFAYVKAFGRSVNIGFWRGVQLDDPDEILEGEGDRMKHLTLREGGFWTEHLVFRHALRTDPVLRDAYGRLKQQLAERYPSDRESYISGKGPFVQDVLRNAGRAG